MTRYRIADIAIPDAHAQVWVELEGSPLTDGYRIGVVREGDDPESAAALPREWLVEVKPPSIDDLVALPLEIPLVRLKDHPQTTLRLIAVGHDSALEVQMLGDNGHEGFLVGRLVPSDILKLAQAAWQLWQRSQS